MNTLKELGMKVSSSKSGAVLAVKGGDAEAVRRRFLVRRNGVECLRVADADGSVYIPVKMELAYLGILLSNGSYELQSAKHRCKLAKAAFSRLHRVLRTGSVLSKAAKLRVYRACVWPVLTYGLPGLGLDARALDTVFSTVAMHLRKILRLYQHGITNKSVFAQANFSPEAELLHSAQAFLRKCSTGDGTAISAEGRAAQRISRNLQEVVRSRGSGVQPHTQASEISCPVCGLYFRSEAGLVMRLKSKHKETHENAKVKYVKSQHSMFGFPMCKFCMKLQCDWQSLEKHITMGVCAEIKAAVARGITMDQLLEKTDQAHASNPPQPPEAMQSRLQHKVLFSEEAEVYSVQNSELGRRTGIIRALSARCALCGQVLLSGARVKPRWRKAHPAAWAQASHDAISECKSLASIFRKQCQFCGSQAKNSNAHAGQCSAIFQVMAGRRLRLSGLQGSAGQDEKAPKQRSSEVEAAYKSFDLKQTPLVKAFQKGAGEKSEPTLRKASFGEGPYQKETLQPAGHAARVTAAAPLRKQDRSPSSNCSGLFGGVRQETGSQ